MSIAAVRDYFAQFGMADNVLEFSTSSATVELAAQAVGCESARPGRRRHPRPDRQVPVL